MSCNKNKKLTNSFLVNAVFEFGAGSTRSWTEINIAFQSQGYSCRITAYESYGKTFHLWLYRDCYQFRFVYFPRYVATAPIWGPTLVAAIILVAIHFTPTVASRTVHRISMSAHTNPFAQNTLCPTSRVPQTTRNAQYALTDWYPRANPSASLDIYMVLAAATAGTTSPVCRAMPTLRATSSSAHYAMIPLSFLRSKSGESVCQIGRYNTLVSYIVDSK